MDLLTVWELALVSLITTTVLEVYTHIILRVFALRHHRLLQRRSKLSHLLRHSFLLSLLSIYLWRWLFRLVFVQNRFRFILNVLLNALYVLLHLLTLVLVLQTKGFIFYDFLCLLLYLFLIHFLSFIFRGHSLWCGISCYELNIQEFDSLINRYTVYYNNKYLLCINK